MDYAIAITALLATCIALFAKSRDENKVVRKYLGLDIFSWGSVVLALLAFALQIGKLEIEKSEKTEKELDAMLSLHEVVKKLGNVGAALEFLSLPATKTMFIRDAHTSQLFATEKELKEALETIGNRRTYWDSILPGNLVSSKEEIFTIATRLRTVGSTIGWTVENVDLLYPPELQTRAAKFNALLCERSKAMGNQLPGINGFHKCSADGKDWSSAEEILRGGR